MRILAWLLMATPAFAADPIGGIWQTPPGGDGVAGLVQIAPCGTGFCGTVVGGVGPEGRAVPSAYEGEMVLRQVTRHGTRYQGGEVMNPETGDRYAARLILDGDWLDVGGCVMVICRSGGVWRRVN
ncbi:DUF2147 domain-containing protein [Falsirhodobacter sp. alg1]|uniref:DUF2147 domain-containing protein n=1 Tax=Falsirhodobacter sp. alg1 TaxID=1472418 RepID=UPI000787918F|nr:DUF2147 domain-containing protein [Falsirhodobacter sp. alg1]